MVSLAKGRFTKETADSLWREAAGEAAYKHSRPAGVRKGALVVNVDGSSWLYELTMRKRETLKALADKAGGVKIKDIKFRIRKIE